ncbi:MAG: pseudouridine synthase [Candidatus Eremiobacteraeota bacterium]|nr:pseudouridine synthase [Candidatus Eremiobacteraeota bacterium]
MPTYLAFHKPFGMMCRFTDPHGRPTLKDAISVPDVYPMGRLDLDSEGLLLLSDDNLFQTRLLAPGSHQKTYWAQVEHTVAEPALEQLRAGVVIQGKKTLPAEARLLDEPALEPRAIRYRKAIPTCWIELTLREGRNRQVRRMTAAVGHPTLRLVRVKVGSVELGRLAPGQYRELTAHEMEWVERVRQGSPTAPRGKATRRRRRPRK